MRLKEGGVTLDSTLTEFLVVHLYLHVVDALDKDEPGVYLGVELDGDSCYLVSILLRRSQLLEIVPVFSNLVFLCL